jgi:thioredoxin reductase
MRPSADQLVPPVPDPASVAGKQPPVDGETDLLIIGAGPAGMAAALTAASAGQGVRVTLVDENPIPLKTMGEDVPLHFGGRMAATLANQNAVLEHILEANPQILEAMEAGVDVRLGTAVWGVFPPLPTAAWIGGSVAGLADPDRVYLVRFKQLIVATGRRDMGLAFAGWQRPGVMGVSAAYRLATTYDALESKVAVLVGSDTDALQAADALAERGVRIEAVVEQSARVVGSGELLEKLTSRGTRVLTGHVVREACGDAFGVTAIEVGGVDEAGRWLASEGQRLACDTVLLGVGAVPAIELLEACGCKIEFQEPRGGHVPVIDAAQCTSVPNIHVAGDCGGVWPSKTLSESVAQQEGRIAAQAAVRALGSAPGVELSESALPPAEGPVMPDRVTSDVGVDRVAWVRACVLGSPGGGTVVCQCEEVTAEEILTRQPPRYLGTRLAGGRAHTPDPDVVKRLTRAGMGTCQGRRCREQIAALIALDARIALKEVPLATYRTPVRPLTLAQMARLPESPRMADHWDSWFGMPIQRTPFWRLPGEGS